MDHLGHHRFAVAGVSGGGPYAAAVAAGLGARVTALALISPVGPIADTGCGASTAPLPSLLLYAALALSAHHGGRVRVLPLDAQAVSAPGRPARNLARLPRRQGGDRAARHQRATVRQLHARGCVRACAGRSPISQLFSRPWGVDLVAISAPTRLWLGTADNAVPLIAARALADLIPGCRYEELAGEGHLWVATNYPRVLEWVRAVAHAGVPAATVDR